VVELAAEDDEPKVEEPSLVSILADNLDDRQLFTVMYKMGL
jgi:hypothetical protein